MRKLVQRAPWMEQAACRGRDPDDWYPRRGESPHREVLPTCAACPVRRECLAHALAECEQQGIWAGATPKARRMMRGGRIDPDEHLRELEEQHGRRDDDADHDAA